MTWVRGPARYRVATVAELGVFREVGRKFDRYWDVAWYEKPLPHR